MLQKSLFAAQKDQAIAIKKAIELFAIAPLGNVEKTA